MHFNAFGIVAFFEGAIRRLLTYPLTGVAFAARIFCVVIPVHFPVDGQGAAAALDTTVDDLRRYAETRHHASRFNPMRL